MGWEQVNRARWTWGQGPRLPYTILAAIGLLGAIQSFGVAAYPPPPEVNRAFYSVMGLLSLALAVLLVTVGPRLGVWVLGFVCVVATVMVVMLTWASGSGEGQLLCGFSLLLVGIFAAYFLSLAVVRVLLVLMTVLYPVALVANPQLARPWYGAAALVASIAATIVVAMLVRQLRDASVRDPLTLALNRRGLEERASLVRDLNVRSHLPTSVVEIDLNGFKAFNDSYGHAAGDALLVALVDDWQSELRRTDILSRTGGDEFVAILPGTTRPEAEALVARMRAANPASWSWGIVIWEQGEDLPEALKRADAQMYLHKSGNGTRAAN